MNSDCCEEERPQTEHKLIFGSFAELFDWTHTNNELYIRIFYSQTEPLGAASVSRQYLLFVSCIFYRWVIWLCDLVLWRLLLVVI